MARWTPCDSGDCPYNAVGGMDCRNYCGLGVDDDGDDYEPDDSRIEEGYDPYSGCYTDDC